MMFSFDELNERLDCLKSNNFVNTTDAFAYMYGPIIAMYPGFETYADQMATQNDVMNYIMHAAYILRRCSVKFDSLEDLRSLIRDVIVSYSEYPAFDPLATEKLNTLVRDLYRERNDIGDESVMTDVSPVVPYAGTSQRQIFISEALDNNDDLKRDISENFFQDPTKICHNLLLNHPVEILRNHKFIINDFENPAIWHKVGIATDSPYAKMYYLAAYQNYKRPPETLSRVFTSHDLKKLFNTDTVNYSTFESVVEREKAFLPNSIVLEDWIDSNMGEKEEAALQALLPKKMNITHDSSLKYDINSFYNYAALHREVQFDTWSQRYFLNELQEFSNFAGESNRYGNIISISSIGNGMTAYELSSDMLVVPFTDTSTYQVKFLIQRKGSDKVEVYDGTSFWKDDEYNG